MSHPGRTETEDIVSTFQECLRGLNVDSTVVNDHTASQALEDRIEYPAVGVPLEIDGVSLPSDVADPSLPNLKRAKTGITNAEIGIASQGSVVVTPDALSSGPASLYPPKHIAVLRVSDIVRDTRTALEYLSAAFESGRDDAVFITGPSSTGDMGELVVGVHGPTEVEVLLVE